MKLSLGSHGRLGIAAAVMALVGAVVACSSSAELPDEEHPTPVEGGTLPPPPEASVPVDAGADADADADAGPPRVCSDDGFCHTVLPKDQTLRAVWGDGLGVVWAVSEQGSVLRYDGTKWSVHTKLKGALRAIWGSGPADIWVGGEMGLVHGKGATSAAIVFADARAPGDTTAPISSIWGTGASDVWAAGGVLGAPFVGRVLHYGDDGAGGTAWSVDGASSLPILYSRVWGSATSGVWLAGVRTNPVTFALEVVVVRKPVGAPKWGEVALPGDPQAQKGVGELNKLYDASISPDGTMWVLGRTNTSKPGYVRGTSSDGGLTFTWAFVPHGPSVGPLPTFVGGLSKSDAWIGGEYGRLRHFDGTTWTQARLTITKFPETTPLYAMWSHGQDLWVVGDGIAMYRDPSKKN